jgi:hypothetical protein
MIREAAGLTKTKVKSKKAKIGSKNVKAVFEIVDRARET